MFGHIFKYGFLTLVRTREVIFWTLVFPFALCMFMYLAFGNIFETTEKFQVLPVAVVSGKEDEVMEQMLKLVSAPGENQLLDSKWVTEEEAGKLLSEEKVYGVIYIGESVELEVYQSGMEQTMLQMILDQFVQYKQAITDVGQVHPEKLMDVIGTIMSQPDYFSEKETTKGNQDNVINYFYAIFAMTCLFACYAGSGKVVQIQADTSDLGQRRSASPTHKMKTILAEFLVCEVLQFSIACLLFVFMRAVLGLEVGDNIPAILLLLFMGTSYGLVFGMFIGSLPRLGFGMKIGILTGVSLALCALSDLMASGIKDLIEHHVPIINDLNPAALITDSFYALNVYDTYGRFFGNLLLLGGGTVLWGALCYVMLRRTRYASL